MCASEKEKLDERNSCFSVATCPGRRTRPPGAYVCAGVVWFTAAMADLKFLLLLPMIAAAVYVLRERCGSPRTTPRRSGPSNT